LFARRTNWNLTTNAYTRAIEEHRHAGRELLDLTASNPTTIGLHYDQETLLAALANPQSLIYDPSAKGLLSAREAIAGYYAGSDIHISPDGLLLTTSTSEGYSFLFRLLCEPGDAVLVPTPSYPLFDFLADLQDVKLLPYELVYDHGWQMDFHSLHQAVAKSPHCKAVLVVHPNNPTGSYVKPAEAAELSRFCAQHDMAIISDEVFLDYSLRGASFSFTRSEANSASQALTLTLSGLSKIAGLPQMKVAWIAVNGPEQLKREALDRLEVIADTYLSMNAPVQWAIPAMIQAGADIRRQLTTRTRTNLAELDRQLSAQKLCSRLDVEGGWYVIMRVPVTGSDEELAIALLRDTDVLVQPGHFYDFAQDGYLVISLITPEATFREGIKRFIRHLSERE
jgi:aspartate/methionine/tyrosine aminotransferase